MSEQPRSFFKPFLDFWASLSTPKRIALLVVTGAVLVGVLAVAAVGSQTRQAYLFTELSSEDAAAIAEKLNELKVPHQIEGGGTAIMVPEDRVHALRLELASAGLPRGGGVGFEIFDQSHLGATEFEQRVNLRRALEGELSRSMKTIEGVKSARVHLVMPERRLFAARKEAASASVVLKLQRGKEFGKAEVAGVVHLVASAVPGLSHDRVSVVSTDGLTLHRPNPDGAAGAGAGDLRAEQAREVSLAMEEHVRTLLERVVGVGKADVRIHAELDAASRERTEEHYEPSKTALRSEHKTEEAAGAEGATVAGVPGAQSNLPEGEEFDPPTEEEIAAGGGNVLRRSHTRNWEVDRITEKIVIPSGDVRRLSVAVLLDGKYEKQGETMVYVPRDPKELERLGAIVKSAVGFSAERGDVFQLESTEFAKIEGFGDLPDSPPLPWHKQYLWHLVGAGAGLVAFLAAVILVWRRRRKKKKKAAEKEVEAAKELPQGSPVAELIAADDSAASSDEGDGEEGGDASGIDYRSQALELASTDPATAAVILKSWLNAAPAAAEPPPAARS